jgi:hypothetical protein
MEEFEWRGFRRAIPFAEQNYLLTQSHFPKITVLEKWELAAM